MHWLFQFYHYRIGKLLQKLLQHWSWDHILICPCIWTVRHACHVIQNNPSCVVRIQSDLASRLIDF
jgi:hypothetical protein